MIFVVLGTQERPFTRLLDAIENAIVEGDIKQDVIVQAGFTPYESSNMDIRSMIPIDEFNKLISEASIIICHAGYGILSSSLEKHKKVIAAARSSKYGEHLNEHQNDILDYYAEKGYILPLRDFSQLGSIIKNIDLFTPKDYTISFTKLQNFLCKYIDTGIIEK